jgi:hypothetical protein
MAIFKDRQGEDETVELIHGITDLQNRCAAVRNELQMRYPHPVSEQERDFRRWERASEFGKTLAATESSLALVRQNMEKNLRHMWEVLPEL